MSVISSRPQIRPAGRAAQHRKKEKYLLRLYVTGTTPKSMRAIANVKRICEEHLQERYDLEVVDLFQQPQLAQDEQIFAVPTLIRRRPPPLRQIIGDMSETERVLVGLDMQES